MLDDQNVVISNLKLNIKDRDAEIASLAENKNKYRDFYDDKLQKEYDENDRLKAKNEELQQRTQELEDEIE